MSFSCYSSFIGPDDNIVPNDLAWKCVDNAGSGGNVDVCVDIETGEINYAVQFDGWPQITEIDNLLIVAHSLMALSLKLGCYQS